MRKIQLCKKCKDLYKKCKGVYSFSSLLIGISFHYARSNKPLVSEPSVGAVFPQKLSTPSTLFSLTTLFIGERGKKVLFLKGFSCIIILEGRPARQPTTGGFKVQRKRRVWISTYNPQAPSAANNQYWHQGPRRRRGVVIYQHRRWGTPLSQKGW